MEKTNQVHEGRNIKRFREMLGIKQEALAYELGEDWSQKKVSQLEARETVEEDMLVQVAAILKVPVEAIKNFDEAKALNIISNTFHKEAFIGTNENFNINPIEHWLKALEENKNLYERLLEAEKSKAALLEKLLQDK